MPKGRRNDEYANPEMLLQQDMHEAAHENGTKTPTTFVTVD
jgi:hypothetical protein